MRRRQKSAWLLAVPLSANRGALRSRTVPGFAALLGLVALLLVAAPAQAADRSYVSAGSFASEGSADGALTHPRRVAVESATGNVVVADRDNHRIQVFAPTGGGAAYLTQFGAGTLEAPFGVAIDQSNGDVYVSDPAKEQIFKFESDGASTPTYTVDGSFTSPAKGSAAGQVGDFEADLAVDPTSAALLVADPGNNRVSRYGTNGAFDSSFDGAGSPDGTFSRLLDLDVAPNGDVYVVDSEGPVLVEGEKAGDGGPETCVQNYFCNAEPSRVLRFDGAGAYQSTVLPLVSEAAGLVTVDPNNSQVVVGIVNPQTNQKVRVFAPGGARLIDSFTLPNFFTWMPALAIGGDSAGRLYATTDKEPHLNFGATVGEVSVKVFAPLNMPDPAIDPVGTVTGSTAQVSGSVNPGGNAADWRFQYRLAGAGNWIEGPKGKTGTETSAVAVSGELSALAPNTTYEVRLLAENVAAGKQVATAPVTFATATVAPIAVTRDASPRTTASARLNAYVTANNSATTYRFEWGPTAAYGNSAPASEDAGAGSDGIQNVVSQEISGLQPGSSYHFRVIATNAAGTTVGDDVAFTTRTATEMSSPQRGIELVNSPDKGNQNPSGYLTNEGEQVVWTTMTGSPGSSQGKNSIFLAKRQPSGWSSASVMPKPRDLLKNGELAYALAGASADYTKLIYRVGEDANFGVTGDPFYFVRFDTSTGQQEQLAYLPKGGFEFDYNDNLTLTADDGTHFYTSIREQPDGASPSQLYDLGAGTRHLVSVLPETGEPPACGSVFDKQWHVMSRDGRRFYFLTRGDNCSDPMRIYLYDNRGTAAEGDDTVERVSTPPVAGPEGDSYPIRASASGDRLLYHSYGRIASEDSNDAPDVYLWTQGHGSECVTCVVPDPGLEISPYKWSENVVVSRDLSHVYLASKKRLVPNMGAGYSQNLYRFSDGEVSYISPVSSDPSLGLRERGETTPDGRVLTFTTFVSGITSDDNGGFAQSYRYSEADGSIECLSCQRGAATSGGVTPPRTIPFLIGGTPPIEAEARALTHDGSTFVFKTDEALVPRDANGGPDVYEWHNGSIQLITDGEGEYGGNVSVPLSLEGITRDGTDVLFRVSAQLTGFERDGVGQLFVARAGGGFPPPQPPAACREDACQGPLDPAPGITQPGSATAAGNGQATSARKQTKKKRGKKSNKQKKCKPAAKRGKATKGKRCGKGKKKGKRTRAAGRNRGGK